MSWSDRYVKLKILGLEEVAGDNPEVNDLVEYDTWEYINPLEISSYGPSANLVNTEHETKLVHVFLKNGRSLEVNMPLEDFERLMDERMK